MNAVVEPYPDAELTGRVKGRASVAMRFHTLNLAGDRYEIATGRVSRVAPGTKKQDAAKIAIPAAGGAIIGGLAGGKKGAAIGGAIGGGGGTGVVLATRGREVRLLAQGSLECRPGFREFSLCRKAFP